jgi:polyphenol oxidase
VRLPPPFRAAGDHVAIDLPGARVLFTTRRGGVSEGPYASLNLGLWTDDDPERVRTNRARVLDLVSESGDAARPYAFAQGRQVHGADVRRVVEPPADGHALEPADGQATAWAGVAPVVLVADCLPIALAAPGAVAMLHAGWRGLAAGVIEEGAAAVRELAGRAPAAAAIGPGAGGCCYEVGEEVHAAFAGEGRRGANLDLKAIARRRLEDAGVSEVHDASLCTICSDPALFFSHRRDGGVTGRQAGVAWRA